MNKICLILFVLLTANAFAFQPFSSTAEDDFDAVRTKWKSILIGTDGNATGKYIEAKKTFIATEAQKQWASLNKQDGRTHLWPDLSSTTLSAHITQSYRRIYSMALACSTPGALLYQDKKLRNDIISALEWMNIHRYAKSYNDWWDFAIGAPLELNNCITLMYDELTAAQRDSFINRVAKFAGDPTTDFGANRAWRAFVYGLNGVLKKDSAKIAFAKNALSLLFQYAKNGEGFFSDGSFIQHANHPYNLGYGINAIAKLSDLLYLLDGSKWAVTDTASNNLYNWIYTAFEPFMYKGRAMDMVRGREMARGYNQDYKAGNTVTGMVAKLAQFAPQKDAANFKQLVKYWLADGRGEAWFSDAVGSTLTSLGTIGQVQFIMDDAAVVPKAEVSFYRQFPVMDRAVKRGRGFALGIAMHSTRIANYEADIKAENIKGWHTGDGMTYLYNTDTAQYSNNYWPTVDAFRLPGTTVLKHTPITSDKLSDKAWVGGVSLDGLYGVSGMGYQAFGYTLCAKKSWFLFDDEVVALGAGITSDDNKVVETIIENRKLNNSGTNRITFNGKPRSHIEDMEERTIVRTAYAHLSGTVTGSDVGYYFPAQAPLKMIREKRTGNWKSVNDNPVNTDTMVHSNYFATFWFDHGANPKQASYSYVLLPGKSVVQTARYATKPQITILRNDTLVQAVKENTLHITGATFWTDKEQTVGAISCDKKAAVMLKQSRTELLVSVSDPTQLNNGSIRLKIDRPAQSVITKSDRITIVQLRPTIILDVQMAGATGNGFEAKFKM